MVLIINSADELHAKLQEAGENLVIIDFYADWCGPCKAIAPKIEELSKTTPDVYFYKVNVDECEDLAQEYDVKAMPTFVFIKKGKAVESFAGANLDKVIQTMNSLK